MLLLLLLLLAPFHRIPPASAIPAINPLSITPKAIPASGNVDVLLSVPRSDVDPIGSLFRADDTYAVTLLFLPGTVLPVPPRVRLQITVPCTVVNLTHVAFKPLPFSNPEVTFQVTALYTGGKVPVALVRAPNLPCVLQVFSQVTQRIPSDGSCSAAGPCFFSFQGYGFNTDASQYRCVLMAGEGEGDSVGWSQSSPYSTAQALRGGGQQVNCSIGELEEQGEGLLRLKLQ
jgi:hypothetical protein